MEAAAGRRLEPYEHGELPYENTQDLQLGDGQSRSGLFQQGVAQAAPHHDGMSSQAPVTYWLQQALSALPSVQADGTSPSAAHGAHYAWTYSNELRLHLGLPLSWIPEQLLLSVTLSCA